MPLSNDERARIIETQALKADVESELAARKPQTWLSDFRKQLILLGVGFLLTTAAGGFLTYYWKKKDWTNQQAYLAQQRALDKKYAIIDRTFKQVALTTSAAEDVLWVYYSDNLSKKDVDERMSNWYTTSRNWRVESKVLSSSLAANFANPEISKSFEDIVVKRQYLGNAVMNLPKLPLDNHISREKLKTDLQSATQLINDTTALLHKCGSLMTAEVREPPANP